MTAPTAAPRGLPPARLEAARRVIASLTKEFLRLEGFHACCTMFAAADPALRSRQLTALGRMFIDAGLGPMMQSEYKRLAVRLLWLPSGDLAPAPPPGAPADRAGPADDVRASCLRVLLLAQSGSMWGEGVRKLENGEANPFPSVCGFLENAIAKCVDGALVASNLLAEMWRLWQDRMLREVMPNELAETARKSGVLQYEIEAALAGAEFEDSPARRWVEHWPDATKYEGLCDALGARPPVGAGGGWREGAGLYSEERDATAPKPYTCPASGLTVPPKDENGFDRLHDVVLKLGAATTPPSELEYRAAHWFTWIEVRQLQEGAMGRAALRRPGPWPAPVFDLYERVILLAARDGVTAPALGDPPAETRGRDLVIDRKLREGYAWLAAQAIRVSRAAEAVAQTVVCAPAGVEPRLSERQYTIVDELLVKNVVRRADRVTTAELAEMIDGCNAAPDGFKQPVAGLVAAKLLESCTGRGGGVWLTDDGVRLAQSRRPPRDTQTV